MAKITVRKNGSLLVEGDDVTLVDWDGKEYALPKRPFSLCRCGASGLKPFCDGSHSRVGFAAEEGAGPSSGQGPA